MDSCLVTYLSRRSIKRSVIITGGKTLNSEDWWQAHTPINHVGQGRTIPFRVRCERWNPETYKMDSGDWLIKAPRAGIIGNAEFFQEIAGHRLARKFGLQVTRIAVVELDEEFIESLKSTPLEQYGFESGLGVGSQFLSPLTTLNENTPFLEKWQQQATALYAFDMLMGNDDRTIQNPNCGVRNGQLLPYDFERIFSGGEQPAWKVSDYPFVSSHIFHRHLSQLAVSWDDFLDCLDGVTAEVIHGQITDLPMEWATPNRVNKLLRHFEDARSNRSKLKDQLDRCLRKPLPHSEVQ